MEKRMRVVFLAIVLAYSFGMISQEKEIIRPGLIRAMGTISPSKMLSENASYFYLHGNLEGYLSKHVSVCGEGYYFLGAVNSNPGIEFMHNLFYGFSYHVGKNGHDLFFGIQPGMAFVKLRSDLAGVRPLAIGTDPVFSSVIGYNFYMNRFFHFFVQSRIIIGEHNYDYHKNISEFRFSAGLGFNIHAIKGGSN